MQPLIVPILLAVVLAGCGDTNPAAPRASVPEPPKTPALEESTAPEPSKPVDEAQPKTVLNARAEILPPQDGFPNSFDLSLGVAENDAVSGTCTVGGAMFNLSGALLDGRIRLWATGAAKSAIRGGFFVGEIKADGASGNFAMSGNGGSPNIRGTWKTL